MTKTKVTYTRILSSCIVLSMILTGFAAFFTSNPGQMTAVAEENQTNLPLLRVYGEHNAVYPTQSYYGANDFIYPEEYDPFDPGIIEKDSITFNPAFWHGHGEYEIQAQGDASEKIFLRAFYEPGYTHPVDAKMNAASDVILHPVEQFDSIVTETTYFLTNLTHSAPQVGYPGNTKFVFPTESTDAMNPGMEHAELIEVSDVNDMDTMDLTDGAVQVEKEFIYTNDSYIGDIMAFLDHEICIQNFENNDPNSDKLDLEVSYIGNMDKEIPSTDTYTIADTSYGQKYYFDRLNNMQNSTDPAFRWYLRVESVSDNYLRIVLGRWLEAGETFYVDGVRYDMPAVYVNGDDGFKYITLQSPIPKGETIWHSDLDDNVDDWSHVTSQYLASLPKNEPCWMLPPFNTDHKMIDDIGLQPLSCGVNEVEVPLAGKLIAGEKEALCFKYVDETNEERFDTSLTERLNTTENGEEVWEWYNVYTKPNQYTEFVLPDQEKLPYPEDPTHEDNDKYETGGAVDGNEYLITSSLVAPNSNVDINRDDVCKMMDEHEIYDRVNEIALVDERADVYQMPRLAFEFDAVNPIDFYVNEDSPNPSVRIYGEEDFIYPTHSFYGPNDFVYPLESDPFDPGVIDKDSITFNPAFWHGHEDYEIRAQGDASEKIFLRAFYEPGYTHPKDSLLDSWSLVALEPVEEFDSIITETTYMTTSLDHSVPQAGYPDSARFVFPYESTDDDLPGMEHADLLKIADTWNLNTSMLTDGAVKIEKEFEFNNIDYSTNIPIEFLDHKVVIKNFEDNEPWDKLDVEVSYLGNMYEAASQAVDTTSIWEDSWSPTPSFEYYYDRANQQQRTSDPANRWYLRVENADDDYLRITLGRWLFAGETFYVDGVRYDMPAVYVADDGAFKYITLQSPLPKGNTVWHPTLDDNVNDWSHVTSQYLASLPENDCVWMLPPFNTDHKMIDDIGLHPSNCGPGYESVHLPGKLIAGEKEALCFKYVDETNEERFDTSLTERLKTIQQGDEAFEEVWQWYNVYTQPNHYTEFMLPDQEDPMDTYDIGGAVDGNEYLITSSFIAPNSHLDIDRRDTCKAYDEHEIFSRIGGGSGSVDGDAQLAMILDGSGSISSSDWTIMKDGLADAIRYSMPHDGSVELTVVQFSSGLPGNAQVEVGPVVVTNGNYENTATMVEGIVQDGGLTPLAAGINLATTALSVNASNYTRQLVNIVTDGYPNVPNNNAYQAAENARNNMISTLGFVQGEDEIDVELVGVSADGWLKDNIVWPQPGYDTWPPFGPGWIRHVETYTEFAETIDEKFGLLFEGKEFPRFVFEHDAVDGTGLFINGNNGEPPVCDCNGPYVTSNDAASINLNGCNSYDPDGSIVEYEWSIDGTSRYQGPSCSFNLALEAYGEGLYDVELCVTDNDGLSSCCTTTLEITNGPGPVPPNSDCNGPYYVDEADSTVELMGCASDDPDGSIVNYEWIVDGTTEYTGSDCSFDLDLSGYSINPGDSIPVELIVTDDDGLTDSCMTTIEYDTCPADVIMEDVTIVEGANNTALLKAENVNTPVGSGAWTIMYDPAVVMINNVDFSDFETMVDFDNTTAGILNITAWNTGITLDGNFKIARINFTAVGTAGDSCSLTITKSELSDDTPAGNPICNTPVDGVATIISQSTGPGDMNQDSDVNSGDIRYLALYIAGDPDYSELFGDGDVNSDGKINSADVRYLALYLAGDPDYNPLYP